MNRYQPPFPTSYEWSIRNQRRLRHRPTSTTLLSLAEVSIHPRCLISDPQPTTIPHRNRRMRSCRSSLRGTQSASFVGGIWRKVLLGFHSKHRWQQTFIFVLMPHSSACLMYSVIPAAFSKLLRTKHDFALTTVAQPNAGGTARFWPRGAFRRSFWSITCLTG